MARAGLKLSLDDLATLSDVRKMTISKFERGGNVLPATVEILRISLVAHGAEFINGGQSIGVTEYPATFQWATRGCSCVRPWPLIARLFA